MLTSVLRDHDRGTAGQAQDHGAAPRQILAAGAIAACAAAGIGLAVLTLLVLAGWIAGPHGSEGLTGVLRAAAALWLIGHHVGFTLRGTGRIGMLPLGLVLLPGALLWRAGKWAVRSTGATRLAQVGYTALALAGPYALLAAVLAGVSRSAQLAPSVLQALAAGFALALVAGGLGGARALAPWAQLTGLMPARLRSVVVGAAATLAGLLAAAAALAAADLAWHLPGIRAQSAALAPGAVGTGLLLLAQLAYLPNALIWAVSYLLGPGFAFGTGTIVAPTGSALGALPKFPMLAALPAGLHPGFSPAIFGLVLAVPYLAGAAGGAILARAAPTPALEAAPMWGFASGALAGGILAVLAAFAGGPLGDGRLAEVGPSGWQTGLVAVLELGIASALCSGAVNWRYVRRARRTRRAAAVPAAPDTGGGQAAWPAGTAAPAEPGDTAETGETGPGAGLWSGPGGGYLVYEEEDDDGHVIFVDMWAGDGSAGDDPPPGG